MGSKSVKLATISASTPLYNSITSRVIGLGLGLCQCDYTIIIPTAIEKAGIGLMVCSHWTTLSVSV